MVKEFPVPDLFGKSAAHPEARDAGSAPARLLGPFDASLGHRFAGSNDSKLREAVHKVKGLAGKVRFGAIPKYSGAVLKADLVHAHLRNRPDVVRDWTDSRLTACQRLPETLLVMTESADDAHS